MTDITSIENACRHAGGVVGQRRPMKTASHRPQARSARDGATVAGTPRPRSKRSPGRLGHGSGSGKSVRAIALVAMALWCAGSTMTAAAAPIGFKFVYFQHTNMVHSGLRGTHVVALTFDDGPNPRTDEVLNVLKANHVLATFVIVGRMAHLHPEILQRIAD